MLRPCFACRKPGFSRGTAGFPRDQAGSNTVHRARAWPLGMSPQLQPTRKHQCFIKLSEVSGSPQRSVAVNFHLIFKILCFSLLCYFGLQLAVLWGLGACSFRDKNLNPKIKIYTQPQQPHPSSINLHLHLEHFPFLSVVKQVFLGKCGLSFIECHPQDHLHQCFSTEVAIDRHII